MTQLLSDPWLPGEPPARPGPGQVTVKCADKCLWKINCSQRIEIRQRIINSICSSQLSPNSSAGWRCQIEYWCVGIPRHDDGVTAAKRPPVPDPATDPPRMPSENSEQWIRSTRIGFGKLSTNVGGSFINISALLPERVGVSNRLLFRIAR